MKKLIYTYSPLDGLVIRNRDFNVMFTKVVDLNNIKWYIVDSEVLADMSQFSAYKYSIKDGLQQIHDSEVKNFPKENLDEISIIREKIDVHSSLNNLILSILIKSHLRFSPYSDILDYMIRQELPLKTEEKRVINKIAELNGWPLSAVIQQESLKFAEIQEFVCFALEIEKEVKTLIDTEEFAQARTRIQECFETMRL